MHMVQSDNDDDYEPRFSSVSLSSCLCPSLNNDSPRRSSVSYNKLHQQPITITILKLDGSSFGVDVVKTGTVGQLKRAVEEAFSHLPKKGPGKVSWEHVWGQFCLSHEGQKLLNESDYIGMIGIKDGDQLQFVHHASTTYNLVKIQSEKHDSDSDDGLCEGNPQICEEDDNHDDEENSEDSSHDEHMETDDDAVSRCKYRLMNMLRCWFPYHKLGGSNLKTKQRKKSSRLSSKLKLSFKKRPRTISGNQYESPQDPWNGQ